jgi:hypothetical protein
MNIIHGLDDKFNFWYTVYILLSFLTFRRVSKIEERKREFREQVERLD